MSEAQTTVGTFYRPASLEEALEVRAETGAVPLAGGTDLLVRHRSWGGTLPRIEKPVVYLGRIGELSQIDEKKDNGTGRLEIGAMVTYAELLEDARVPELLKDAAWELAAPGLRNVATLAGNICNASPAADAVCALYALDAAVQVASPTARREVPIEEFILGPGKTALASDELVVGVSVPETEGNRVFYQKVGTRRANALSKLSICAHAAVEDDTVSRAAIALGAVAPTVVRVREAESRIVGASISAVAEHADDIVEAYRPYIRPISDQRSTAEYRRDVAAGLVKRFLSEKLA